VGFDSLQEFGLFVLSHQNFAKMHLSILTCLVICLHARVPSSKKHFTQVLILMILTKIGGHTVILVKMFNNNRYAISRLHEFLQFSQV